MATCVTNASVFSAINQFLKDVKKEETKKREKRRPKKKRKKMTEFLTLLSYLLRNLRDSAGPLLPTDIPTYAHRTSLGQSRVTRRVRCRLAYC